MMLLTEALWSVAQHVWRGKSCCLFVFNGTKHNSKQQFVTHQQFVGLLIVCV